MSSDPSEPGHVSRRDFILLTLGATIATGCQSTPATNSKGGRVVDAGPAATYAADGLYNTFRDQGFFLISRGGKLVALSAYCTHRQCKLTAEPDRSFYCECHGSTFDPTGKVTEGPATRNLPILVTSTDANGHLLVTVFPS